mgnify:CR=1 FL=1
MSLNIDITINYLKIDKRKFTAKDLLKLPLAPFDPNNTTTAIARFSFLEFIDLIHKQNKRCSRVAEKIFLNEHIWDDVHHDYGNLSRYVEAGTGFGIICNVDDILHVSYAIVEEDRYNDYINKLSAVKAQSFNDVSVIDILGSAYAHRVLIELWRSGQHTEITELIISIMGKNYDNSRVEALILDKGDFEFRWSMSTLRRQNPVKNKFNQELLKSLHTKVKNHEISNLKENIEKIDDLNSTIKDLPFVLI